ncbi:hypothetical protein CODIS_18620 [Candidatus Thiodiazotropha endolucinida]|uniref:Uncharacterized protein n=1 Tax=Candidatus Thiodiazotropha endolucinida TaxID=1655433 RepID=A0A7Z0VMA8_9GAMM|nr:hypothetical protein CODIS_18620 [Candidatus Thiodiazotropha endolucinida]
MESVSKRTLLLKQDNPFPNQKARFESLRAYCVTKCDQPPTLLVWLVPSCVKRNVVPATEMLAITLPRGSPGVSGDLGVP